ncbi:FtsX-like permease family protein [Hydrogenoanaerobacterium sp.]|uniref:ABC transporter permease n=1 Tax=Hydrogenoanaerobacterium sp. TaxID=2953763 RepID=UPI00289694FD|nr:FtsX-like permease family protein [Hydrogenoanaerobacterium sp.]
MVKYLFLKMLRDIQKSAASYLVAAMIVAVGFAGYSVLSIAAGQLEQSKQYFFKVTSFADAFAEVQQAPLSVTRKLEQIEGIKQAQGRLVKTVQVAGMGQDTELRLLSIEQGGLNLPLLSRGSLPWAGERQIVLGDGFSKGHGLSAGDTVELAVGGRKTSFEVTGSGISPENIYMIKNINELLPTPETYDAAFMDYRTMARLFSMEGRTNNIVFTLEHGVEFADVEDAVKQLLKPYGCYRVYENKDELSVSVLEMELEQLNKVTTVIPFMFLFISAIILYITLHRLIEQQRTQIGTMMAMGIPVRAIALHYTGYGAAVGFCGGLGGGIYGSLAAGPMADFYRAYFSLPNVSQPISMRYLIIGTLVATCFCAVVGGLSTRISSKLAPAQALRPAAPKTARRLFLEKLPGFIKLLTVPGLMAVRSIARNRRRSALSLFGIACAYMITATLVSMNSMFDIFLFNYLEKNQRQDITVAFSGPVAAHHALSAIRSPGMEQIEGIIELPVKLRGKGGELDCVIQGMDEDSSLCRLYDENDRQVLVQPEGIVLSVHMAGRLGVKAGDSIEVEVSYPEKRVSRVAVTGIMAQYLGSNAYMSHHSVGKISDYRNVYTSVLIKAPAPVQQELRHSLDGTKMVASVQNRQQRVEQYHSMMGNISGIMAAMAAMGVLVGFAVIYTSSLISFEELKREIATMRMLGLSDKQCLDTVSVNQWILTCGAVVLGIPMTMAMSRLISKSMALEMFSIPDFVDSTSLVMSIGLIFIAVAWSNRVIYKKLKKITPVELLRERE